MDTKVDQPKKTSKSESEPDAKSAKTTNENDPNDDVYAPGEDAPEDYQKHDHNQQWHDFESQFSVAIEHSAVIEREKWGSQCEFLMSCIASAVGLGNIWRFPFIALENGGGAFLIPYIVVLTIIGRPLYMLELGLGQFCSNGPIKIWEMLPMFRGVGFVAAVASFLLSTFYLVIMSWANCYFVYSFYPELPWDKNYTIYDGSNVIQIQHEGAFFGHIHLGEPAYSEFNMTDFYQGRGLDGPPVIHIAFGLLAAWFLVWAVMVGGVSGSGKIAYFTALFPYSVLVILLIAGCTLDGATDGIIYFFTPKWEKVFAPKAWFQAVGQCFFSLGITFGGVVMFASFNKFHHKLGRDILVISIMDTFTSMLAGSCMFALIGNLAYQESMKTKKKVSVGDVAGSGGAGMAFVTFPSVLEAFKNNTFSYLPNIFSMLFFFMIMVLAVGSANGLVGTTVTIVCDFFPKWKRWMVVTGMCIACFFLGLVYTCPTGNHIIDLVDRHGIEMVVYVLAVFEIVGVAWIYGLKNISNDFEFMLGGYVSIYWQICWGICLPISLIIIFIAFMADYKKNPQWPPLAAGCGWVLTILCWLVIPITAFVAIQTRKSSSFTKRYKASMYPTRRWGPKDPAIREGWRRWKKSKRMEFLLTTKVLYKLGYRVSPDLDCPQAYWSTDPDQSMYQTRAGSIAPSTAAVPPEEEAPAAASLEVPAST